MIGQLNINSIRTKFNQLEYLIKDSIDILLVSETKLDISFPAAQFFMNGFSKPYRLYRNDKGGGIMLYVRDHIPSRKVNLEINPNIEAFLIEINLKKRKWLLLCSYNP